MNKLIATFAIIPMLFLSGCSTLSSFGKSTTAKWLEQAFGDYVRSLEGQGYIDKIPSLIMAARNKWLPAGHQYDLLAANVIHAYVVANPKNNAEVNKVLEALAQELQK